MTEDTLLDIMTGTLPVSAACTKGNVKFEGKDRSTHIFRILKAFKTLGYLINDVINRRMKYNVKV